MGKLRMQPLISYLKRQTFAAPSAVVLLQDILHMIAKKNDTTGRRSSSCPPLYCSERRSNGGGGGGALVATHLVVIPQPALSSQFSHPRHANSMTLVTMNSTTQAPDHASMA